MESDPSMLRSLAIESTLSQFEEMRRISREVLEKAWDDEEASNCEYCHGGMRASRRGGCLTLQFVLEEAYFVAAIDTDGKAAT